jgi:ABC-type phosphate transport system substrate-binding protein
VADIYIGKITKWNDRARERERGVTSEPDIIVVHRSDGSGIELHLHGLSSRK